MNAKEARLAYHPPYTLNDILNHIESVVAEGQKVSGYDGTRMTADVRGSLDLLGYKLITGTDGKLTITWA